ncbi:MAG: metal-dependent hydrolase [Candidatus Doudnabacteria bacterium]|nr:metal-dependent hydrolase [Candidatus Doudnabacteria bacterium]
MLPPGHIAAGFLTSVALVKLTNSSAEVSNINQFYLWGMFWGFAPDFDNFLAFYRMKSWWYKQGSDGGMHRKFYSHIPVLWLLVGVLAYVLAPSAYWKTMALLMLFGSFSHFLLDSIEFGVKWLWPFSERLYALKNAGVNKEIRAEGFLNFWFSFLLLYKTRPTFFLELLVIASALIVFSIFI